MEKKNSQRIDAFLSSRGYCARRKVQDFLYQNCVEQMGQRFILVGQHVDLNKDIFVNGTIVLKNTLYYIALNKPPRYVCSNVDANGRNLAINLIPLSRSVRLHSVGRLDYFSEGLIFFTNDGNFTYRLTHPSYEIEKEYKVILLRKLTLNESTLLQKPINIDGIFYYFSSFVYLGGTTYSITLKEGKNREIRRVFEFFDIKIHFLQRIRIGTILIKDLSLGSWRYLKPSEVDTLTD